jgi:hypothetical protein
MSLFNIFKKKKPEPESNPPSLLMVKLFFKEAPVLNDDKMNSCLEKRFKSIGFPEIEHNNNTSRQYFFKDYLTSFKEGDMPAQGTLFIADQRSIDFEKLIISFNQSWNWKEAESVTRQCQHEIVLMDIMSRNLDYKMRLECFQKYVASMVEALNPDSIWISNSDNLINRMEYLNNFSNGDYQNLNAFLNVRLFNIQESNGELIMDTMGLNALGLPDFEIVFQEYDVSKIAGLLFNYGAYIYENGVVIENGNTIEGIEKDQKWKCFFRDSIVEPKRIVIGIDS